MSQSGGANGSVVPVGKNSARGSNQSVEAGGLSKDGAWGRVSEVSGRGEVKVAVGGKGFRPCSALVPCPPPGLYVSLVLAEVEGAAGVGGKQGVGENKPTTFCLAPSQALGEPAGSSA